jgi:chemotaxis protein MotA
MRILVGLALLAGTFFLAYTLADLGLVGYFNAPALALVGLAPLAVAVLAYEWRELGTYVGTARAAFAFDERASRAELRDGLAAISTAQREGKPFAAVRVVDGTRHRTVHDAGLVLLKHYDRAALREVLQTQAQTRLAEARRAEDFFLTMARAAPAFGLIGTILGFIDLLRHLKDADSLGPGMAMALTATLYGISFSYCLYHPVAKAVGAYARKLAQELKLAEQAALLIHDGRHTHDLATLFDPRATLGEGRAAAAEATS